MKLDRRAIQRWVRELVVVSDLRRLLDATRMLRSSLEAALGEG
ncbi:MAG: hypothetical protein P8Z36_16470 [Gemmatimonadota bacterium]